MKHSVKYLIISDIHLASSVSRSDVALKVLDMYKPNTLIINGDLIDSEHLKRLKKNDWLFLSKLRKLSKSHEVFVVKGNHDGNILDFLGDLLGLDIIENHIIHLGKKKYYIIHGDTFDKWASSLPLVSELASAIHYWLQKLGGRKQRLAHFLKRFSKEVVKCTGKVKLSSYDFCKKHGFDGIIVGHTHYAEQECQDEIEYWNSGCFAEADGKNSYIIIDNEGNIHLKYI